MIIDTDKLDRAALIEAAAEGMVNRRASAADGEPLPWAKLSPIAKHHVRESVLPLVNIILSEVETQGLAAFEAGAAKLADGDFHDF